MGTQPTKWQLKIIQFMKGRYGQFDQLNKQLSFLAIGITLLNLVIGSSLLRGLAFSLLILACYRVFSKKMYVRSQENQHYLRWLTKVKSPLKRKQKQFQDRKTFSYFKCPNCQQKVRVPKNRGKIRITCPDCQGQFEKKT